MNKQVTIKTRKGALAHYIVRQMPHDKPMRVSGRLFGGVIVAVSEVRNG